MLPNLKGRIAVGGGGLEMDRGERQVGRWCKRSPSTGQIAKPPRPLNIPLLLYIYQCKNEHLSYLYDKPLGQGWQHVFLWYKNNIE